MALDPTIGRLEVTTADGTVHIDTIRSIVVPNGTLTVSGSDEATLNVQPGDASIVMSSAYASLAAAVTAIGSTPTILQIIAANFTYGSDTTVPSTLLLEFIGPGTINTASGHTVTILSDTSQWPIRQLFTGTGTVTFTNSKVATWFTPFWKGGVGDGSTDDTAAVQWAITAAQSVNNKAATVDLGNSTWKITSTLNWGDGSAFAFINLHGESSGTGGLIWYGSTSGVMMYGNRIKFINITGVRFSNGVAKGTTVGLYLGGAVDGTQTNGLIFLNDYFTGFHLGVRLAGLHGTADDGLDATSELKFINSVFESNDSGVFGGGSGNTLNIDFDMCSFSGNTDYGLDLGTAGSIHIRGGGTSGNGIADFHILGNWNGPIHLENTRHEISSTSQVMTGSASDGGVLAENVAVVTTNTPATKPVFQVDGGTFTLRHSMIGSGTDAGWIVTGSDSVSGTGVLTGPRNITIVNCAVFGSITSSAGLVRIATSNSQQNGYQYDLRGNTNPLLGAFTDRRGVIVWPNMVDALFLDTTNQRVGILTLTPLGAFDLNPAAASDSIAYFRGNLNGNNPSASFTTGTAIAWNKTGGQGESSLIFGTGAGSAPRLEIGEWDGATYAADMVVKSGGNVGIGTATPGQKLSVVGTIESTSGGFKFPDATTQTTAATSGANTALSNLAAVAINASLLPGTDNAIDLGSSAKTWKDFYAKGILKAGSALTTLTDSTGKILSAALNTVAVAQGGTGQTAYTDGQLLIGNTSTGGLTKATLTAGSNVTITNAGGSITIASTGSGSGANTALSNLASVAINASLLPGADNSIDLGSGTKEWKTLYLGNASVINFNNGQVNLTHGTNKLTSDSLFEIANTAPTFALTDTTASAKSLTIKVDANVADLRESAGASGSLLALDLANNRVGIGTASPAYQLHVKTNVAGNVRLAYENIDTSSASTAGFRLIAGTSGNDSIIWVNSAAKTDYGGASSMNLYQVGANPIALLTNDLVRLTITGAGSTVLGTAAISTSATDGFLYIPTCAGPPTGTPTAYTGRVPLVYDSTNHKLYLYDGGWKGGTVPGVWS